MTPELSRRAAVALGFAPLRSLPPAERQAFADRVMAAETFDDLGTADQELIIASEATRDADAVR